MLDNQNQTFQNSKREIERDRESKTILNNWKLFE